MTAFESEESTGDVNKAENIFQAGRVRFFSQKNDHNAEVQHQWQFSSFLFFTTLYFHRRC